MCFKVPQRWDDMFPLDMTGPFVVLSYAHPKPVTVVQCGQGHRAVCHDVRESVPLGAVAFPKRAVDPRGRQWFLTKKPGILM